MYVQIWVCIYTYVYVYVCMYIEMYVLYIYREREIHTHLDRYVLSVYLIDPRLILKN